jgi:hypothetical protein
MPSERLNPTAKSRRSSGVAIITAWVMRLYVMAIAVSSATLRSLAECVPSRQMNRSTRTDGAIMSERYRNVLAPRQGRGSTRLGCGRASIRGLNRRFVWQRDLDQCRSPPPSDWQPEAWDSSMFGFESVPRPAPIHYLSNGAHSDLKRRNCCSPVRSAQGRTSSESMPETTANAVTDAK